MGVPQVCEVTCGTCDAKGHQGTTTCRECQLREIVEGPQFFASLVAGKLTDGYLNQLRQMSDDPVALHKELRVMAKQTLKGSVPG